MSRFRVSTRLERWRRAILAGALGLALVGCAATPPGSPGEQPPPPPQATVAAEQAPPHLIEVYDPWEGFNRGVYKFNAAFDRAIFLPVVRGYEWVMPNYLQDRVSDFFANLKDVMTLANQILQLKIGRAGETLFRVGVNSLMGMFGLFDLASELGMPHYQEDFGQTLGYWGVGDGPYVVIPILGPSNVRDAAGWATDTAAFALVDPFQASSFQWDNPPVYVLNVINQRKIQSFRYFETGSPFEYELIRFLYTKKREIEIQD
jgi:phospholipid-binding lipoprotein MlaA